jgi:hypothetical protein
MFTKNIALTVLALTGFAAFTSISTLAVFTDQDTVTGNLFATGTINLTTDKSSALVTMPSGMMPGDSTTGALVVANASGSSALRYSITGTATNADTKVLKDALVLTVKTIDVTTPGTPCDDFDGTQIYAGDLDNDSPNTSTPGKLVGDPAQGAQTGDRALAVDGSETLCFRVALPLAASDSVKSATTTGTFTFDSEQTVNN